MTFISSPKENEDGYNIVVTTAQGNQTNPCIMMPDHVKLAIVS